MADFCYVVLCNGVLATALAVVVYFATTSLRPLKRPALKHLLWVLVLLRMVCPPVLPVDLSSAREWVANGLSRQSERQATVMTRAVAESSEVIATVISASQDSSILPVPDVVPREGEIAVTRVSTGLEYLKSALTSIESVARYLSKQAAFVLFPVWAMAAVFCLVTQIHSALVFRRNMKLHAYSSRIWQRRTERVAKRMGLKTCPQLLLVRASISPMLWGFGSRTRILFPEQLLENLTTRAQDTLIAHELAHFRRGDQWVRLLELAAMAFYWWHPVFWWARQEIEKAEEDCCDAWAVRQSNGSPRTYAEALLAVVDFVSVNYLPPAASGVSRGAFLRHRLQSIMCNGTVGAQSLLPKAYPSVFALAVFVLVPSPVFLTKVLPANPTGVLSVAATQSVPSSDEQQAEEPPTAVLTQRGIAEPTHTARLEIDDAQRAVFLDRENAIVELGTGTVSASSFSSDGETLAVGTNDGRVQLLACEDGRLIREIAMSHAKVNSVCFSPDNQMLAVGTLDGTCRLVSIDGESQEHSVAGLVHRKRTASVDCVRFSKNGKTAAVVWSKPNEREIEFWDLTTNEFSSSVKTENLIVSAMDDVASKSAPPIWRFVQADGAVLTWDGEQFEQVDGVRVQRDMLQQIRISKNPNIQFLSAE